MVVTAILYQLNHRIQHLIIQPSYTLFYLSGNPSPGIKSSLYMAGDRTVLPLTPIRHRVGTSPRRGRERVDVLSGSRTEELVFAFSVAQGW